MMVEHGGLARLIVELYLNPPGQTLQREAVTKINEWDASDYSAFVRILDELRAKAIPEIKRQNSTRTQEGAVASWKKRTGIDPIDFHRAYIAALKFLRDTGQAGGPAKARAAIIEYWRDDLFLPRNAPARERRRADEERARIDKSLKGLVERPPAALKPIFEAQRQFAEM